jgi:hypothetical protein
MCDYASFDCARFARSAQDDKRKIGRSAQDDKRKIGQLNQTFPRGRTFSNRKA